VASVVGPARARRTTRGPTQEPRQPLWRRRFVAALGHVDLSMGDMGAPADPGWTMLRRKGALWGSLMEHSAMTCAKRHHRTPKHSASKL